MALITIKAIDSDGKPVAGAALVFQRNGVTINEIPFPDNTGVQYLDSVADANLLSSDITVLASADGYTDAGATGSTVAQFSEYDFTLQKNGLSTALLLGAGIAAVIGVTLMNKRKKVAGIKYDDLKPWLPLMGVVVVGGIVYYKVFGANPADTARDTTLDAAIATAGTPTLSAIEISTTADQLKEDLSYSFISNNTTDAVNQLYKMNNTADALRLLKAYGRRVITTFGIPRGTFTLEETVTSQMSQDDIQYVNQDWAGKGINFKF